METSLDSQKVLRALEFHGAPLMKVWTEENGGLSLSMLNIPPPDLVDTSVYRSRQKFLTQSDNVRRLRLHKFICRSAGDVYKKDDGRVQQSNRAAQPTACQLIPPLEFFSKIDIEERLKRFLNNVKPGDIAYCSVQQLTRTGLVVKILCTTGKCSRMLSDMNIKGFVATNNCVIAKDVNNVVVSRSYTQNDYICCEVLEFDQQSQLHLGMMGVYTRCDNGPPFGLILKTQLPHFYKLAVRGDYQDKKFGDFLKETEVFTNPASIDNLLIESGLDPRKSYSLTMSSKGKFQSDEYAKDLRQVHASKLAFRSVAEGIEHFKGGRHIEAFQCLNKALTIDPQNVEGLVARGALYANSGSFQKAIYDFEAALKLNSAHANAKKYLGETLLALGRSFEDENKFEDAKKAYIECLKVNPQHQEAQASLDYVKSKLGVKKIVEPSELELPPLNIGSISMLKESKMSREYPAETSKSKDDSKKKKKDKKKKGKKRHSSSSESSSESSDSSNSSSDSSDSDSSSDDSNSRMKKKDKKQKEKSISPFSKRVDHGESSYQYGKSFEPALDDHEMKVRKFLEMGRDEDDYEDKVRHLMAETSKYQKAMQDEKGGKKKKKSEKKLKKEKKKRKKEEKKKGKGNDIDSIREALKVFENLPEFAKFQKIYQEKLKEEETKKKQPTGDTETPQEKWKMKFSKDERKIDPKSKAKPNLGFNYDSEEEEDQSRNSQSQPSLGNATLNYSLASTSGIDRKSPAKDAMKMEQMQPQVPAIVARPVVLDKFGNFRLADPGNFVPTVRPIADTTVSSRRSRDRSRSHDRRRYSRSRSDSRSPRRRRRSHSRSYSRSRSRSRGRSFRGRGDFGNRYRRFSPKRGSSRGRWNDRRDFRGGRDGGRFGGGGGSGGGRNDSRFAGRPKFGNNRFNRSFSRSPERGGGSRSPDRRERSPDRRPKWSEGDSVGRPDLNEMEEMLRKGREPDSLSESK